VGQSILTFLFSFPRELPTQISTIGMVHFCYLVLYSSMMLTTMSSSIAAVFVHRRSVIDDVRKAMIRPTLSFITLYVRQQQQQQHPLIITTSSVSPQPQQYHRSYSNGMTLMRKEVGNNNEDEEDDDDDAMATTMSYTSTARNVAMSILLQGGTARTTTLSSSSMMGSLLETSTTRAFRTLSSLSSNSYNNLNHNNDGVDYKREQGKGVTRTTTTTTVTKTNNKKTTEKLIDATIVRSTSVLNNENKNNNDIINDKVEETKQHEDKRTYLNNPSVTLTALAHTLWRSTIHPYNDIVIDATCGNGKDFLALTDMIFPQQQQHPPPIIDVDKKDNGGGGRLIGIDIQECAIRNTVGSLLLSTSFDYDTYRDRITLLVQSHEQLLKIVQNDNEQQSRGGEVGLVCYNLGFLPGANRNTVTQTQTQTTLNSITDAALLLRIGGLLSVMTYPASNEEESIVVEHFMEGLGMLTTRSEGGWRKYVSVIPNYNDDNGRIRIMVTHALERVVTESGGGDDNTSAWRVFVHKPLGRPTSPVLVTATRIK